MIGMTEHLLINPFLAFQKLIKFVLILFHPFAIRVGVLHFPKPVLDTVKVSKQLPNTKDG
jgi:hypothetical protein